MSASRYQSSPELTWHDAGGRPVRYRAPRILPQGDAVSSGERTAVGPDEVDRLDLVAYRVLRDPGRAWQIADANDAMNPLDLCRQVGASIRLPRSGA